MLLDRIPFFVYLVIIELFLQFQQEWYFSSGKATVNSERTIPEAVELKLEGVHVISVAVGGDHNVGMFRYVNKKTLCNYMQ